MAQMNINTADLPDQDRFEPIPAGKYAVQIIESDSVALKTGNGESLNITLEVIEGDFAGRKVFDRLNYLHTNQIAQRIGQQGMKSICKAVGFEGHLSDSEVLHGIPLVAKIVIEQKDQNYEPKNVVKGYEAIGGSQPASQPSAQQQQPAPSAARPAPATTAARPANVTGGSKPSFMTRR